MHLSKNNKNIKYFYLLILIFISSVNNYNFQIFKNNLFKVSKINISGVENKLKNEINLNLESFKNKNIFFLDKKIISEELKKFNYIEHYSIFKKYPSELYIDLKLTKLIGTTFKNNKKFYVGSNKKFISSTKFKEKSNLPNIFGDFEIIELINFFDLLEENNFNLKDIKQIYFFESKRWDIILKNDLLIKFPSSNLDNSIKIAKNIIDSDLELKKVIDLRVSNQVIIRDE
tara:strand:- start:514 stop:1203 length:690 start_codon:yes stop_codon:yes gene_type:complete